jgi:uncharacterized membrane protein
VISRQKVVGWILIVLSAAFILHFIRMRLFVPGPAVEKAEWVRIIGSVFLLMIGTMNVRMAALRQRKREGSSG